MLFFYKIKKTNGKFLERSIDENELLFAFIDNVFGRKVYAVEEMLIV